MIKIVTGVRRCGKSFLLSTQYAEWLREQGVGNDHIITINLEDRRNKKLRDPDALLYYIDSKLTDDAVHYIMIDEIQDVDGPVKFLWTAASALPQTGIEMLQPREKEPCIPTSIGRSREYSCRVIDRKLTLPYIVNIKIFKYLFC